MANCGRILRNDATPRAKQLLCALLIKLRSSYCARSLQIVRKLSIVREHQSTSPIMPCQNNYLGSVPL